MDHIEEVSQQIAFRVADAMKSYSQQKLRQKEVAKMSEVVSMLTPIIRVVVDELLKREREKLQKFGRHLPNCRIPPYGIGNAFFDKDCSCGFTSALADQRTAQTESGEKLCLSCKQPY